MDSVEFEPLGKAPSMYNPAFVKSVREKRREMNRAKREAEQRAAVAAPMAEAEILPVPAEQPIVVKVSAATEAKIRREERKLRAGGKSFNRIAGRICKATGIFPSEILSNRRNVQVTVARQAIVYWLCRMTPLTLPQIGRIMNRDHTTILYAKNAYVAKRAKMGRTLRPVR